MDKEINSKTILRAGITRRDLSVAVKIPYGNLSRKIGGFEPWQDGQRERCIEYLRKMEAA
jgi:hypothetical protein